MNTLEQKIKRNETIIAKKITDKKIVVKKDSNIKSGHTKSWNKGWGKQGV